MSQSSILPKLLLSNGKKGGRFFSVPVFETVLLLIEAYPGVSLINQ
jgi:hypothetical protein